MYVEMLNGYGCSLGTFELPEVAELLRKGEVEPGDKFVVVEPGEDE